MFIILRFNLINDIRFECGEFNNLVSGYCSSNMGRQGFSDNEPLTFFFINGIKKAG